MRGTLRSAVLREALERTSPEPPPRPAFEPETIMETTARMFGLDVEVLAERVSHSPLHADARTVAMLLMRAHCGLSWLEIGDLFGRGPGTCAGAVNKSLGQPHRLAWAKAVQQELEANREV